MPTIIYQRVQICEKVAVEKLVSAGRGRKRRKIIVFKWRCRPTMRPVNIEEYPIIDGHRPSRIKLKFLVIE